MTVTIGRAARAIAAFAMTSIGFAAGPSKAAEATTAPAAAAAREMTAADIEAFLDGIIPLQLATGDIAGASIAIVKDGKILLVKGYGLADVEARKPVSPSTLFRVGSISKTFTWTAVMQQVEAGKIDLDADLNIYLDFKIPAPRGKPVTMRNLMTHRPGFEDVYKDLGATDVKALDLAAYVKEHVPAELWVPGTVPSYSNYGAALAGYVVQRVTGVPLDAYVDEHILKPLAMSEATMRQPLPEVIAPLMSGGYGVASEKPMAFELINGYPAGSVSASANAMARFMLAHLNGGELDGARILGAETAQQMQNTRLELDPALNAMALGFYEETRNGHRIIGHAGDTIAFHSDMHLMPDQRLGFFVSYNSAGNGGVPTRSALWRLFLDRYFPYTAETPPALASAKKDALKVAGKYISSRRADTTLLKIINILQQADVVARPDGTIVVSALRDLSRNPRIWREIAPMTWRAVNSQETIVFKPNEAGRMQLMTGVPVAIWERTEPLQNQNIVILGIALPSIAILVLTLVLAPVGALLRWHYGAKRSLSVFERILRLLVLAVCAADLVFLVMFMGFLNEGLSQIWAFNKTLDPVLKQIGWIGLGGAAGTILILANAFVAWGSANRGLFGKLYEWIVAFAAVGFTWFIWAMNMIDQSLRY